MKKKQKKGILKRLGTFVREHVQEGRQRAEDNRKQQQKRQRPEPTSGRSVLWHSASAIARGRTLRRDK